MYDIHHRIGIYAPKEEELKSLLEGGRSNTYPDEIVISTWDR